MFIEQRSSKQEEYYKAWRNNKDTVIQRMSLTKPDSGHYNYKYAGMKETNCDIFPYNFVSNTDTVVACGCARMYVEMGISDPMIFAALAKNVILFEPDNLNFSIAKKYINDNKIKNIELVKKAVWNKNETIIFSSYKNTPGGGNHIGGSQSEHLCKVEGVTLDAELNGRKIDFLHLTINGKEYQALQGAEELLKTKPKVSVAVISKNHEMFQNRKMAIKLLKSKGYQVGWAEALSIPWLDMTFWFAIATSSEDDFLLKNFKKVSGLFPEVL